MRIVLNGRSGKVGSVLAPALEAAGHSLVEDESGAEAMIDFTAPAAAAANVLRAVEAGVPSVVGTTGWDASAVDAPARAAGVAVFYAPNFAIGAVLMMRFAAEASRHLERAEIVELHHATKVDAPSGTALDTAMRVARERDTYHGPGEESLPGSRGGDIEGIRIHSVRLPGLVAHQEVLFGGPGQTLSIRHDAMDRTSFMPGVLLAIKGIHERPGLTVGLESLLGLS